MILTAAQQFGLAAMAPNFAFSAPGARSILTLDDSDDDVGIQSHST
jgi:hypothetical protein